MAPAGQTATQAGCAQCMHETETYLDSPWSKSYKTTFLRASQPSGVPFASRQASTHEAHPAQTLESIQNPYWTSPLSEASEETAGSVEPQEESAAVDAAAAHTAANAVRLVIERVGLVRSVPAPPLECRAPRSPADPPIPLRTGAGAWLLIVRNQ